MTGVGRRGKGASGQAATRPFDAVAMPTVACPAFPHGERHPHNTADLTAIASATGNPAVSLPLPVPPGTLPIGLQLVGRPAGDLGLCQLATALEAEFARVAVQRPATLA